MAKRSRSATRRRVNALAAAWQLRLLLAGLIALTVAATTLPRTLQLPTLSPLSLPTPATMIIAWFAAVLAAQAGFEPAWDLYATEGSRPRIVNLTRVLLVAATGTTICGLALGQTAMSCTAVAAFLGVALLGGAGLGHRLSWLPPTTYLLIIIGAGALDPTGAARLWAIPGNPNPDPPAYAVATSVLLLGALAWWHRSTRQSTLQYRH